MTESTARDPQLVAGELNAILREVAESYPGQVADLITQRIASQLDSIAQDVVLDMAEWIRSQDAPRPENIEERLGIARGGR